ncbi:acyl-CoA dehydrogenase family protein [Paraconexibacter antarcticus]|uniref:Acyl-CoA dehydrogenase family protein n=1 Tax=Paraconexibacter antarcticus TaxID=2949664 RepID=A0ABY5DZA5_9ACTN|nr:acyl-CoA dehydrogenase family protein [Paraconexibacter antarcticus]UTI66212.1 acyl-CoA dehydrogenase family protein [Paraconexibacter antarcticus]
MSTTAPPPHEIPALIEPEEPHLDDLRARVAAAVSVFTDDEVAGWEEERVFPEELYDRLRDSGLLGLTVPVEYGGEGQGVREACVVLEELAYRCGVGAAICQMFVNGPPRAIYRLGDEAIRQRYLPGVADGSRYFSIAMSEPHAGSAVTELTSYLEPDGDGYRLHGSKCYITGGMRADAFLVFCRAQGTTGSKGLGAVVIERGQEGFTTDIMPAKMGGNAIPESVLTFDGVRIDPEAVVLTPDPTSSAAAMKMLRQFNPERCGNAAMALGIARAALERAIGYSRERQQFHREICEFQGIQWKLADMATRFDAARLLLARASASEEGGFPVTRLVMQAKIAANEAAEFICREAMQIHGHWGYCRDLPVERHYRDARGLAIGGGTLETNRNVLAAEVLGRRFDQRPSRPGTNGSGPAASASTPEIPSLVPELSPELEVIRVRAADVAAANLADAQRWDDEEIFPESSWIRMRDAGLLGLTVPKAYGGEGLGVLEACIVLEELSVTCMSSAMVAQMYLNGPPRAVLALGTEAQRRQYLPGTPTGERYWSIAISEPQAGSSATELQTRLEPDGEGYRLHGGKCYITGGMRADTYLVFCRLAGTTGAKGIGAVIVERGQDGFAEPQTQPKMGGRGVGEAVLGFDGIRIEPGAVIVPADPTSSKGAAIMLRQFNPERCGNAAMCVGVARAALADSLLHLRTRQQFGKELAEFQGLQWKVADMSIALDAARALNHRAAASDEGGFPITRYTAMAKIYANEAGKFICDEAVQLHGHAGYCRELPVERYYRDVRGMGLGGGTTEIMRNVLAGEVIGRRFSQR